MAMGLPGLRCCGGGLDVPRPLLGPARARASPRASALRYSSLQAGESLGEEVLRMFLAERQAHGDFVTKISDMVWRRSGTALGVVEAATEQENSADVAQRPEDDVAGGGMLRLAATRDWVSGESSLPVSKRLSAKDRQNESERRKELNLLRYEALKDELLLLTAGVGAACSLYCLLVFSLEAAISYAFGVAFSCLYLQLLYRHTDNLSKKDVPEIFLKKKVKRIGIRSEDLKNTVEKTLGGITVALSSPRLVIPAIIFGLSTFSDHFQNSILNFELVPGMMGFFAYKAAALVQVYRDNEDLRLILPEEDADSS
ncbi:uncharacterized protein LOC102713059 [Oryza brachyantha]|uniref:Uncharacterized protein n=1 Tax=Oryza brachyantha TaxID=4533 RepID=J3LNB1_ORYBR|nr:uncharacterized protein LOC102713059 [Oryza brachyantha]